MTISDAILISEWVFVLYFVGLHGGYILLTLVSMSTVSRYMQEKALEELPKIQTGFEPPITVLVPAYNEEANITACVRSLLQLQYSDYEVLVINDGSTDRTLEALIREFSLVLFPEAYRDRLATRPVRGIYRSRVHPQLRVLDKVNGGKADSLNAGLNGARNPLFCGIDADSILQRDSLERVVQPFLEDPTVVATGGVIRIANGCQVRGGFLVAAGLPRSFLPLVQIIEYLRAFLFGRVGWSPFNALLIISGAFGLYHKETVIGAGGFRTDTLGEDMELVVRLHRLLRKERKPFRIILVPDPVCWTEAPEDLKTLRRQRMRWQRGLCESLWANAGLLFSRNGGVAGWVAFPFLILFEGLGPIVEVLGYVFTAAAFALGLISIKALAAFLFVAVGLGLLLSVTALLLEEISFHVYPKLRHILLLLGAAVFENFGYRQLVSFWRLVGLLQWAFRGGSGWGEMTRKSRLQSAEREEPGSSGAIR